MNLRACGLGLVVLALGAAPSAPSLAAQTINPPPTAADWAALGQLPDWSGVWAPDMPDQRAENDRNPPPWTPRAAAQIKAMNAEEEAGRPKGLFIDCLPESMPSWMLISHNAMEVLFTPGRVTLLGESDGNRLRRIYTDGRPHPDDPDLTFHGHSIGHWEGDTLVVDTVGILPEALVAITEAAGVPNNGDMHITERIRLIKPDTLQDELTIAAPNVLTKPWVTRRLYDRHRQRVYDIVEGVCLQGGLAERKDKNGDSVFVPMTHSEGIPIPND